MRQGFSSAVLLRTVLLSVFSTAALGYYHFVHYPSETEPFLAFFQKFDLNDLVDDTVHFTVDANRPKITELDSYEAIVSQIRQALAVWDSVPTSSLRVSFGGITDRSIQPQNPGGQILFAELPPGVLAMAGPVSHGTPRGGFIPILRSQVILSDDFTQGITARPSFSEQFFNSLVHEIGHALGLQHSLASAAMSTEATRATTRARPLSADDVAGLSVLYPTPEFGQFFGSLAGRVVFAGGSPVNLASVAAVSPRGEVVTSLSGPDGRYRIDGLLPGRYTVYAEALPEPVQSGLGPADIVLPSTADGTPVSVSDPFRTVFYGGTTDLGGSELVMVVSGETTRGIDFQVFPRRGSAPRGVTTFSFPGNGAPGVHPAFLDLTSTTGFVLAAGSGPVSTSDSVQAEVLSGDVEVTSVGPYGRDSRFSRIDFRFSDFSLLGPKHLLFRVGDQISILPSAFQLVSQPAPVIYWVTEEFDPLVDNLRRVHGINFDPSSRVYFDGAAGELIRTEPETGDLLVRAPPGNPDHRAVVTVYNPDGQSSAFTLPDGNVSLTYPAGSRPFTSLSPDSGRAGSDVLLDVRGRETEFHPGQTIIGFGTSDLMVRDIDVLTPQRLRAVVTIRGGATPGQYPLTVITGLQVTLQARAFTVLEPAAVTDARPAVRFGSLVNAASGEPHLSPGVLASLFGEALTTSPAADSVANLPQVTFNGVPARIMGAQRSQINLQIPPSLPPGKVVMVVNNGRADSEGMLVEIGHVSPGLFAAIARGGTLVGSARPANPGDELTLLATGLGADPAADGPDGAPSPPSGIRVAVSATTVTPSAPIAVSNSPGLYRIAFQLPSDLSAGQVEVSLLVEGRRSNRLDIPLVAAGELQQSVKR